jgi:U4/U6 small nuclear ribonucleoprotein PRP31
MADGTTTTLADTLLDDLDDLSDGEEEEVDDNQEHQLDGDGNDNIKAASTSKQPSYLQDAGLQAHLAAFRKNPQDNNLIIASNKYLIQLATTLTTAHENLVDAYNPKLPELADLVRDAHRYKNAVQQIGNEMDVTTVDLSDILTPNQIITISVASSTTSGRPLADLELAVVHDTAKHMEDLWEVQEDLTKLVENRMSDWAPNTSALVGSALAAQLISMAGGLAELSRIPACNLQVLGQVKATDRAGLSSLSTKPHAGILHDCDLVQAVPSHLHKKALKMVAAKLALAIRCDCVNVQTGRTRSAASGEQFRAGIEERTQKWQAPDKAQTLKALPKPDLTVKKRRGGKRMRRLKERFEETELMKQANTRAFSSQTGEYGDDAMGLTLGMLDNMEGAGGAVRKKTEKRKMGHANTKASRKRQAQMAKASSSSNGLASSMVFTPLQGMELIDPTVNLKRVEDANKNWFSKNAGFQSALPRK